MKVGLMLFSSAPLSVLDDLPGGNETVGSDLALSAFIREMAVGAQGPARHLKQLFELPGERRVRVCRHRKRHQRRQHRSSPYCSRSHHHPV
jgi:hypothetical protein